MMWINTCTKSSCRNKSTLEYTLTDWLEQIFFMMTEKVGITCVTAPDLSLQQNTLNSHLKTCASKQTNTPVQKVAVMQLKVAHLLSDRWPVYTNWLPAESAWKNLTRLMRSMSWEVNSLHTLADLSLYPSFTYRFLCQLSPLTGRNLCWCGRGRSRQDCESDREFCLKLCNLSPASHLWFI